MKGLLFITYIILFNLFQGLAFNSSENCICNEAFNISWTGIRNATFTPTPDPNGYFCPDLECYWVFYNEITLDQVLILGSNISNNFPFVYQINNCQVFLHLLDETLTTTYTQESQICVYFSTGSANSTENFYFKLTFQLQNTQPSFQTVNLSDLNSGFPPFSWVQLKPPSSQNQISVYSFLTNSALYGYIVTEYEHSFNNGLVLVYGGYKSLINYYEYALWNGSSLNEGNGLFYSIYTTAGFSYLSPTISLTYTKGSNQSDVYAFFTISELFQACSPIDFNPILPIQYAYPDNQTFSLNVTRALSTSLCYGLIVLPQSGRLLKFTSFDLKQNFTFQVTSFGYDFSLYYTLFEVDNSTAEQYANSFVFTQLIVIMTPEIANISLSLNFEYVKNSNFFVHNSTRGVVMSPNYPESGVGQISQFEIQCIVCLENNFEGEFLIKLDYIDFGQKYYINISSDNVNYTLFYAFNKTEGLDLNQTHILSGKTISIDYNTYWDANDITRGFLLSYEIRSPATQCPSDWISGIVHPKKCYKFATGKQEPWFEAKYDCSKLVNSASLISIEDAFENSEIWTNAGNSSCSQFYIGLLQNDNEWAWANGDPSNYRNWKAGYPTNDANQICAVFDKATGKWTNQDCDIPQCYICEMSLV